MSMTQDEWRLPHLGQRADVAMPGWLVSKMMDGAVELNRFGGLTLTQDGQTVSCMPGDTVLLIEGGLIGFTPSLH